jgi:hypothetical protein
MPTQPPNTLVATALTTLDQAKLWLGIPDLDPSQDDRLTWNINSATAGIQAFCQDEFVSAQGTASPRTFVLDRHPNGYLRASFGLYALQSANAVVVDPDQTPTGGTVDPAQYQLAPLGGDYGVYRSIRIYSTVARPVSVTSYQFQRTISVAGTWGYPSVPADVEQACLITVAKWYRKDQTSYSNEFGASLPQEEASLSLPYDARVLLLPYRRTGI